LQHFSIVVKRQAVVGVANDFQSGKVSGGNLVGETFIKNAFKFEGSYWHINTRN
jgi:hypothetical protein